MIVDARYGACSGVICFYVVCNRSIWMLLIELQHLTATECHLPYRITQCYLLPNTSKHTPP